MKYYLGMDMSLNSTGVCILDENYKIVKIGILHTKITSIERLFHLKNKLDSFVSEYKDNIVMSAFESYAYGRAGQELGRVFEIGEWGGVAKLFFFENGLEYILVAPTQLKKYITGKGDKAANKKVILLDIYKNYNEEIRQDDEGDAYVLARIAKDFYNKEKNLTLYQVEVIKAINKSIAEGNIGVFLK